MAFFVYVLANAGGATYVGQTSDLQARVAEHNDPGCTLTLHTKRHVGPWRLIYHEECQSRKDAMKREKQLKSGAGRRFIRSLLDGASGC